MLLSAKFTEEPAPTMIAAAALRIVKISDAQLSKPNALGALVDLARTKFVIGMRTTWRKRFFRAQAIY
jgi:hypothetical protein